MSPWLTFGFVVHIALLATGITLALNAPNLFVMWLAMELSSLLFIPLLSAVFPSKSIYSSWKYLVIQVLTSVMFFIGAVVHSLKTPVDILISLISLLVKLGMFPFLGWGIHLSEGLSMICLFFLSTTQKIPAVIALGTLASLEDYNIDRYLIFISVCSLAVTGILMIQNSTVRWMMVHSSSFNISWMAFAAQESMEALSTYVSTYFFTGMIFFAILYYKEQIFSSKMLSKLTSSFQEALLTLISAGMAGVPPLGLFLGKLGLLSNMVEKFSFLAFLMLFLSTLVSFFYLVIAMGSESALKSSKVSFSRFGIMASFPLLTMTILIAAFIL